MTPVQLPACSFSITRDGRATLGTKGFRHYFVPVCGHMVGHLHDSPGDSSGGSHSE